LIAVFPDGPGERAREDERMRSGGCRGREREKQIAVYLEWGLSR